MSAATAGVHTKSENDDGIVPAAGSKAPQASQPAGNKEPKPEEAGGGRPLKSSSCFGGLFSCMRSEQSKSTQEPRPSQKRSNAGPAVISNATRGSSKPLRNEPEGEPFKVIRRTKNQPIKLLLLGTSESGKSTLLKNFKLHLEGPYSEAERESMREILWSNAVSSMRTILEAMESLEIPPGNPESEYHIWTLFIQPQQIEEAYSDELRAAMTSLIADSGVQTCMARSNEYQLPPGAKYCFANIERIGQSDYMPTDEDILMSRVKTIGLPVADFEYDEFKYTVIDFGGVRAERKKWVWGFPGTEVVIFAVDASNYDQLLYEDENVNRMQEQLVLFKSIFRSPWFLDTNMFLVFTKMDRFRERLQTSPMEKYFPDYTSGPNFEQARDYLVHKFLSLNIVENRTVPTYFLDDVSTSSFGTMFSSIHDHVIQEREKANNAHV